MKTPLTILFLLMVAVPIANAQTSNREDSKVWLNLATSPDNFRYNPAVNYSLHREISVDLKIGEFTTLGIFAGHQNRASAFMSTHPFNPGGNSVKVNYERDYFPIGIRGGLHITEFFKNSMGLISNPDRWDIYLMIIGGATLSNERFLTDIEGEIIEFINYESEDDVQYILGFLTGVRYYPFKNFGVFFEGGAGPVGRINFGLTKRFKK